MKIGYVRVPKYEQNEAHQSEVLNFGFTGLHLF